MATSTALILFVPTAFTGHLIIALGLVLLVASVLNLVKVISVHRRRDAQIGSAELRDAF